MKLTMKAAAECQQVLNDNPPASVRDAGSVLLEDYQAGRHIDPVALGVLCDHITKTQAQDRYGK